jgi:nitrogen fixation/metabolism regulation signal transduction histidine kinase
MSRAARVDSLQRATEEYVKVEKKRLENETKFLKAVLQGRTAGAGIQQNSVAVVQAVAESDLASYLKGD